MRRLNAVTVICIVVLLLIHAVAGSLSLFGFSVTANKIVARICMFLVLVHLLISSILTVRTLRAIRLSGTSYFKGNELFWVRRISGFVIIIPLVMHIAIFMNISNVDPYRLKVFTTGRLISQIFLVASIALHVISNIRPALISYGIKGFKALSVDFLLVLSIAFLVFALAFAVYYIRWMAI